MYETIHPGFGMILLQAAQHISDGAKQPDFSVIAFVIILTATIGYALKEAFFDKNKAKLKEQDEELKELHRRDSEKSERITRLEGVIKQQEQSIAYNELIAANKITSMEKQIDVILKANDNKHVLEQILKAVQR